MSSTHNRIRDFFDRHIANMHKSIEDDQLGHLDLKFDKDKDSYFTAPKHPQHLYLNSISFENEKQLADYLNEFWKQQPALLDLIPDLVTLAFILKEKYKEQSGELSPFVYAMF